MATSSPPTPQDIERAKHSHSRQGSRSYQLGERVDVEDRITLDELPGFTVGIVVPGANSVQAFLQQDILKPLHGQGKVLEVSKNGVKYFLGRIHKCNIVLLRSTEFGKGASGTAARSLSRLFKVRLILGVGLCWGMDHTQQRIGDIIIMDNGVVWEREDRGPYEQVDLVHPSPTVVRMLLSLGKSFRVTIPRNVNVDVHLGPMLTSDVEVNPRNRAAVAEVAPMALGGECDAEGISLACHDAGISWGMVSVVADYRDGLDQHRRGVNDWCCLIAACFTRDVLRSSANKHFTTDAQQSVISSVTLGGVTLDVPAIITAPAVTRAGSKKSASMTTLGRPGGVADSVAAGAVSESSGTLSAFSYASSAGPSIGKLEPLVGAATSHSRNRSPGAQSKGSGGSLLTPLARYASPGNSRGQISPVRRRSSDSGRRRRGSAGASSPGKAPASSSRTSDGGERILTCGNAEEAFYSVDYVNEDHVVSGSSEGRVAVWNWRRSNTVRILDAHPTVRRVLRCGPRHILSSGSDNVIRVWNWMDGAMVRILKGHVDQIHGLASVGDDQHIVSGAWDNSVRVWDWVKGECRSVLAGHTGWVFGVAVTKDRARALSGGKDRLLRVWDIAAEKELVNMKATKALRSVVEVDQQQVYVGVGDDRIVRVWDPKSSEVVCDLRGHSGRVYSVVPYLDGYSIITASADRSVRVWDTRQRECVSVIMGHSDQVFTAVSLGDGQRLISGGGDGTLRLWVDTMPGYED